VYDICLHLIDFTVLTHRFRYVYAYLCRGFVHFFYTFCLSVGGGDAMREPSDFIVRLWQVIARTAGAGWWRCDWLMALPGEPPSKADGATRSVCILIR
jgi:hypothetical protein